MDPAEGWHRFLLLAGIALLLGLPQAAAGTQAEAWSTGERSVMAWPDGGGFTIRSTRDAAAGNDEIAADYDAQAATLHVALQATEPEEASLSLGLALRAVSEFRDTDGDGRLGPGEPVLRRVAVPGTPATASVTALPGGSWRATSTHTLPADAATPGLSPPRLQVTVEARPAPQGGAEPTQFDVEVRLLDAWARNGTHVALETGFDLGDVPHDLSADRARMREGRLSLDASWQDGQGTVVEGGDPRSASFVRTQPAGPAVAFPLAIAARLHSDGPAPHAPGGNVLLYVGAAVLAAAALAYPAWRRLSPPG